MTLPIPKGPFGWDWFDDEKVAEFKKTADPAAVDEFEQLEQDFARVFRTPHGKRVLSHLRAVYFDNPTFNPDLGLEHATTTGCGREGQRMMYAYIERMIRHGSERS